MQFFSKIIFLFFLVSGFRQSESVSGSKRSAEFLKIVRDADNAGFNNIVFKFSEQKQFSCDVITVNEMFGEQKSEASGLKLLKPLFTQSKCLTRVDGKWTFEVCHGKHVRRYYEDEEGNTVEYIMGKYEKNRLEESLEKYVLSVGDIDEQVSSKIFGKKILPYYEITMEKGSVCMLNDKTKSTSATKIFYVCSALAGISDNFLIEKTSPCQYEITIPTRLLCNHPKYNPPASKDRVCTCCAPLRKNSEETMELQQNQATLYAALDSFLSGTWCLSANVGDKWGKCTFCYGKVVKHFIADEWYKMGVFNQHVHLKWIRSENNQWLQILHQRGVQLSHFYAEGDACEGTKQLRQTQVLLYCKETANVHSVVMKLWEPSPCQYILRIESPLICPILTSEVDENGLFRRNKPL